MSHKVSCAVYDPSPGRCDCGLPSLYQLGYADGIWSQQNLIQQLREDISKLQDKIDYLTIKGKL